MKSISLSKPINICGRRIKNRIVVPPMSDFGTVAPDGLVHQSHIDRYEAYAKGGAGLIIIEACSVLRMPENRDTLCLENDDCIPGIKSIADIIHHYSAVTLVQIMLTGLETMEEKKISEISRDDFLRYKEAFISAAIHCQKAGADIIDVSSGIARYSNIPNNFLYDSKIYAASLVKNHVDIPVKMLATFLPVYTYLPSERLCDSPFRRTLPRRSFLVCAIYKALPLPDSVQISLLFSLFSLNLYVHIPYTAPPFLHKKSS